MKKKSLLLLFPFLASCSFSYSKAITIDNASLLLKDNISHYEGNLLDKKRYGLGVTEIEDVLDSSFDKIETDKKTFFLLYFDNADEGFSFDYFLNEGEGEIFLTLSKDQDDISIVDNLTEEERPFDEEKDKNLKNYFSFPTTIFKKIVKECLNVSNIFLASIQDADLKNDLTSYSASSNGDGELSLSFEGKSLPLSSLVEGNDVPKDAFNGFRISMQNGFVKSAALTYLYAIEETKNTKKGTIYLDFELL